MEPADDACEAHRRCASTRWTCSSSCSSQVEDDASSDAFYSRLCEATCALTSMDRAVIFRYDEVRRRVRAAGAYGIDLDAFADAHVTVESAPVARQSLEEDRVIEVTGDYRRRGAGGVPRAAARVQPRLHAARRRRPLVRRDPVGLEPARAALRRGALPAVDARQDGRARHAGARGHDRRRPRAPAAGAHRPRARRARERDPAAVRRAARVLVLGRAQARGARADRRRAAGRARGPAARAAAAAGPHRARDADDAARGGRPPARASTRIFTSSSGAGPNV